MHDVQLSDSIYEKASAVAGRYQMSVEAFIEEAIESHVLESESQLDDLFTDEVLHELDLSAAEAHRGESITLKEFDAALEATKAQWRARNQT